MVARCHDRRLVGPRRADGRVDRRTSGGRRDRSRAGPPGRRRATLWAKRPIGAVRVPGLARALGARNRGWSDPRRRAHATASSICRSRDRDELRRPDLPRRARYGGSSRSGVADRFSVDDHVSQWARRLPRASACGGRDLRRDISARRDRWSARKGIRRVVRDHRYRHHVTVAARARIERGVVMRLREAPDGRPRREHLAAAVRETLVDERLVIPAGELRLLERWLEDRLFGLGELAPLLRDDRVTEVMVNGTRGVWVERDGRLEETAIHFADSDEILVLIERLVAPLGRRIDLASPLVDARLPDGSRVHAVIPPISLVGPVLTIRRFAQRALSPEDLVRNGTLPPEVMAYLVSAVRERRSVLVSGGTSSGKTTTLNALAFAVGDRERIVTIEDAAELRLPQPNVVALETRAPSVEGSGAIDVRALLRAALRMRPDRIVVGEVRGGEALDMLQAMNTGHRGSLTTAHANGASHALMRIETMALMGGIDLPLEAIREQIRRGIDVVVHQERDPSGVRRVVEIAELSPERADPYRLTRIYP